MALPLSSTPPPPSRFEGIDAGLYGTAVRTGMLHWVTSTDEATVLKDGQAKAPAGDAAHGMLFVTVPLHGFHEWVRREWERCGAAAGAGGQPVGQQPRLELATSPATREFLKCVDHGLLGEWTAAGGCVMVTAGDYNKAALDLRHWCDQHPGLRLILDEFAQDGAGAWQAGLRLGVHHNVYLLARGLPGLTSEERGLPMENLPAAALDRAEELYHAAVGELGTERILFGSGLHVTQADLTARQAAVAEWFRRPREWLDAESAELIFGENARRLSSGLNTRTPSARIKMENGR